MSTGNNFGLSEISHFGTFKGVGGKAGGFINKKFFHPSNFQNQEKLWKAQTEDERERKKQIELERRRDEERQVEELRKQMYLAGQGSKGDFLTTAAEEKAAISHLSTDQKTQMKEAIKQQQQRRAMLKQQSALSASQASPSPESDEEAEHAAAAGDAGDRKLAKSRYKEDVYTQGHKTVWGSWYSVEEKKWGFQCCKLQTPEEPCPHAEEPEKAKDEPRGKRRRRGGQAAEGDAVAGEGGGSASSGAPAHNANEEPGGASAPPPVRQVDPSELMDTRMVEAAAKRQKAKSWKEMQEQNRNKDDVKKTGYLADLLQDPSAG